MSRRASQILKSIHLLIMTLWLEPSGISLLFLAMELICIQHLVWFIASATWVLLLPTFIYRQSCMYEFLKYSLVCFPGEFLEINHTYFFYNLVLLVSIMFIR